jgi:hypothetical protein
MFNKTKENIKWFFKMLLKRTDSIFKNGGMNWSSTRIMSVALDIIPLVIIPLVAWAIIYLTNWSWGSIPENVIIIIIIIMMAD